MSNIITANEIEKWLKKIRPIIEKIHLKTPQAQEMYENMKAYISDSNHFLENGDYVRAFEAVIWAWAIYEICMKLGVFE